MDTRKTAFVLAVALLAGVLLQPSAALGTEAAAESTSTNETKRQWLSLLLGFHHGLGSYENITRQRGDPPSPVEVDSYAKSFDVEAGLEVLGLGISYDWNLIYTPAYHGSEDYVHEAGNTRQRIKGVYPLRGKRFHLIPEFGYVFVNEDALIHDRGSGRPDRYLEEYKDEDYYYGLSARARLRPVLNAHWWLYARYVHDNLGIQVDNYQLELQLGDEYPGSPDPDDEGPDLNSAYFSLAVKWSQKTDGRSAWFITIGLTGALRLL
jgi:hypothetical protein